MTSLDGLHPTLMLPRVQAVLADPEAKALGLYVVSAFRSPEKQKQLFDAAVKKYGSEAAARKWVAPPGKSNHGPRVDGYGTAVDFGVPGTQAVTGQWPPAIEAKVNAICARHGLASPMDWEDWHFEPIPNWTPPEEDDMFTDADRAKLERLYDAHFNDHPDFGVTGIQKAVTEIGYSVAGVDLPGKPSRVKQLLAKAGINV